MSEAEQDHSPKPSAKPSAKKGPAVEPITTEPSDEEFELAEDEFSDLIEVTPDDLEGAVAHSDSYQPINPATLLPTAWVASPAQVAVLAAGIKLLKEASTLAKLHQEQIEWVRLLALPKRRWLLVAPTVRLDPKAVEASRTGRGPLRFNAVSVLQQVAMHVQQGFRERFRVKLTTKSPIGPAIVIMMGKVEESRAKKKKGAAKEPATGSSGAPQKSE